MNGFNTFEKQDKVLLGLNSGSDAAAAMRILQQQGFAVAGAVVKLSAEEEPLVQSAKEAAKALGIECATLNAEALAAQGATPVDARRGRRHQPYLPAGRPCPGRERCSCRPAAGYPGPAHLAAGVFHPGGCAGDGRGF